MSFGNFSANPRTEWLVDGGEDRNMLMLEDFWYVDPQGRRWEAPRNSVINGASIPVALWSSVGSPYTDDYRRAAVVHDVACANPEIVRDEADEMFYFACLCGGCSLFKSKILYAGVRIGAAVRKNMFMITDDLVEKNYRFPGEHSKEDLLIRAKFTILENQLAVSSDEFSAVKKLVDTELEK